MYHGDRDWSYDSAKNSGLSFVYLKLGQGDTLDPRFLLKRGEAEMKGFTNGAYFFYDSGYSWEDQVKLCMKYLKIQKHNLPVALDFEQNPGNVSPETLGMDIHQWLIAIEEDSGRRPIIYTMSGFWNSAVTDTAATVLGKYELWVANYTYRSEPSIPKGWKDWVIWQYAEGGGAGAYNIKGYGTVDSNKFRGTHDDLVKHFNLR
jgi:lysozyme